MSFQPRSNDLELARTTLQKGPDENGTAACDVMRVSAPPSLSAALPMWRGFQRIFGVCAGTLTRVGRIGVNARYAYREEIWAMKNSELKERLARYRQIKLSVIGRKSGKAISMPVWFVLEGQSLFLLPVRGSHTQWYKNVLSNPSIRVDARGSQAGFQATPITHPNVVKSIVEKFRQKYGAKDVKKYYSKFDVAVLAEL